MPDGVATEEATRPMRLIYFHVRTFDEALITYTCHVAYMSGIFLINKWLGTVSNGIILFAIKSQ